MENLNLAEARKRLFSVLWHVIEVSQKKFDREKAKNVDRQKWGRLIVQSVQTYAKLLDGVELEELKNRIRKIEKELG